MNPNTQGSGPSHSPGASRPQTPKPGPRPGPRGPRPGPVPGPRPGAGRGARAENRTEKKKAAAKSADIRLVEVATDQALERADEVVDELLEGGRAPQEVLVLTTGDPHPWQQHEMSFGADAYWQQLADGADVFYADALMDRQVVRPVVVLAVNGGDAEHAAAALPSALSRAAEQLVVCGDPKLVAALLGTENIGASA